MERCSYFYYSAPSVDHINVFSAYTHLQHQAFISLNLFLLSLAVIVIIIIKDLFPRCSPGPAKATSDPSSTFSLVHNPTAPPPRSQTSHELRIRPFYQQLCVTAARIRGLCFVFGVLEPCSYRSGQSRSGTAVFTHSMQV